MIVAESQDDGCVDHWHGITHAVLRQAARMQGTNISPSPSPVCHRDYLYRRGEVIRMLRKFALAWHSGVKYTNVSHNSCRVRVRVRAIATNVTGALETSPFSPI